MNRLTCTLLSGASIVALMFGGDLAKGISAKAAPADADGTAAGFATTGDVDYIIITGDYESGQDVVVSTGDTVTGPPFASAYPTLMICPSAARPWVSSASSSRPPRSRSTALSSTMALSSFAVGSGPHGERRGGRHRQQWRCDQRRNRQQRHRRHRWRPTTAVLRRFCQRGRRCGHRRRRVRRRSSMPLGAVLSVQAFASDSAAPNTASANAIGVFQDVEDADTAIANVTNNGVIVVQATAFMRRRRWLALVRQPGTVAYARRLELFRKSRPRPVIRPWRGPATRHSECPRGCFRDR